MENKPVCLNILFKYLICRCWSNVCWSRAFLCTSHTGPLPTYINLPLLLKLTLLACFTKCTLLSKLLALSDCVHLCGLPLSTFGIHGPGCISNEISWVCRKSILQFCTKLYLLTYCLLLFFYQGSLGIFQIDTKGIHFCSGALIAHFCFSNLMNR